jgi:Cdc6-like AAA superfamily ATPase
MNLEDTENKKSEELLSEKESWLNVHIYQLFTKDNQIEASFDSENGDGSPAYFSWLLPCYEFRDLWDSLVFDDAVMYDLMNFMLTLIHFGDLKLHSDIISCNRLIVLHGPPGTGKTSICKALAQKLSIRLSSK